MQHTFCFYTAVSRVGDNSLSERAAPFFPKSNAHLFIFKDEDRCIVTYYWKEVASSGIFLFGPNDFGVSRGRRARGRSRSGHGRRFGRRSLSGWFCAGRRHSLAFRGRSRSNGCGRFFWHALHNLIAASVWLLVKRHRSYHNCVSCLCQRQNCQTYSLLTTQVHSLFHIGYVRIQFVLEWVYILK